MTKRDYSFLAQALRTNSKLTTHYKTFLVAFAKELSQRYPNFDAEKFFQEATKS